MKRIDALRGMRGLMVVLVFLRGMRGLMVVLVLQIGYTAVGVAQEIQAEPVDSLSVEAEPVDSYFLNDRAITRIPTKVGVGALTAVGTGILAFMAIHEEEPDYHERGPGLEGAVSLALGLLVGYPVGVYLADPVESSFWMTCVGHAWGFWWGTEHIGAYFEKRTGWVVVLGGAVTASELSRLLPKRYRNPNPFKWLFGKFRRPSPRVSFGLVPELQRGLSARATLRF